MYEGGGGVEENYCYMENNGKLVEWWVFEIVGYWVSLVHIFLFLFNDR